MGTETLCGMCTARLPLGAVCWSTVMFYLKWLLCKVLCCVFGFPVLFWSLCCQCLQCFLISFSCCWILMCSTCVLSSWLFQPCPCLSSLPNCPFPLWASFPAFRCLWIKETADWNSTLCLAQLPFAHGSTCPALCIYRIKIWGWNKPNER